VFQCISLCGIRFTPFILGRGDKEYLPFSAVMLMVLSIDVVDVTINNDFINSWGDSLGFHFVSPEVLGAFAPGLI
jgi:hypothetical protein